ncbi:T9SS type A sorting domain-containing protein [candidate division KSB1 bacterium]|nr:T9SS type A sorting domain-containing protein [candidate division KSB1 bacterium]
MQKYTMLIILILSVTLYANGLHTTVQDDTVKAPECTTVPVIDGKADDACWSTAKWQAIDQAWITWGEAMDPADFTGRYKVMWSSETDRIYFLVEVIDDVLVKGYKYPMDGYYNWDVVEIFFDEDASGGDHTLNQNAFAYHITAGNDEDDFEAMDLTANYRAMNYSDHFNGKIEYAGGVYTWELAMLVYNEDYDPDKTDNPTEQLEIGKLSGLSIAYCDNDNPNENPKTRDNFIGSVEVPRANYNDHWMNADFFGKVLLVASGDNTGVTGKTSVPDRFVLEQNYPNPFNPATTISYYSSAPDFVSLVVYNTQGQTVKTLVNELLPAGSFSVVWDGKTDTGRDAVSGVYYYRLRIGEKSESRKMLLLQ